MKLSFFEMRKVLGEVGGFLGSLHPTRENLLAIMKGTLMEGEWTSEEYSQAMAEWMELDKVSQPKG